MSTLKYIITGDNDLGQIILQIQGEEAVGREFRDSKTSEKDALPINEVTFKKLRPGAQPKELNVVKRTESQPPDTKKVWEGTMVVAGINTEVTAYRSTE